MRSISILAALAVATIALTAPAEARGHRHHASHHSRYLGHVKRAPVAHSAGSPCSSDNNGRTVCGGVSEGYQAVNSEGSARVAYSGGEGVIGGRRAGFPHAFCGAEASYYVFGVAKRELWLAANWIRMFPRASPAPGMAAARSHHVFILISHVEGLNWLIHDGNSGHHLTREHVRSISGYIVVDPHGSRMARL